MSLPKAIGAISTSTFFVALRPLNNDPPGAAAKYDFGENVSSAPLCFPFVCLQRRPHVHVNARRRDAADNGDKRCG